MDLPIRWLNDYVDMKDVPIEKFVADMTMSGSKVEGYHSVAEGIESIVTGRVESIEKHGDSDHLLICSVDIGRGKPLQIVTGAGNFTAGDIVSVALDGAKLPGGKEIHSGELRGVMSEGMLCSHEELGLDTHYCPDAPEHGILVLDKDTPLGSDIKEVLMLDDITVEFEITPNRPDCLGMIGLARETAATFGRKLKLTPPKTVKGEGDINERLKISVPDTDLCPVYSARMVRNIKIAPSPLWMRSRLHAAGVRPINNIVDITNFVMLEYGNPMHAFDYDCLGGGEIIVRRAKAGEKCTTLEGKEYDLEEGMLVIADREKPVGLAGIMGGQNSEITAQTSEIVFESANFSGPSIRATSRKLGLRTDASGRFEKGLDPALAASALERACELVELLGAGEVVGGSIHIGEKITEREIALDTDRINALLGLSLSRGEIEKMLGAFGFGIKGGNAVIPTWRTDVEGIADLAEEIARLYGYNKIPSSLFKGALTEGGASKELSMRRQLGSICRGLGYSEIMTYSFVSPKFYDDILLPENSPLRSSVTILNPLGEDTSIMRTTALPSMLKTLALNLNQRNGEAMLYEMATVYLPELGVDGRVDQTLLPQEKRVLVLGRYGKLSGFYAIKGEIEAMLGYLGLKDLEFSSLKDNPAYHPGRSAAIYCGEQELGLVGQIHPDAAERNGLNLPVYAAELDVAALLENTGADTVFRPLPRFPATTRDLAILCNEGIPSGDIVKAIKESAEYLESVELFDTYQGAQIPSDKKSLAYSLVFRDNEATMTDKRAEDIMAGIVKLLGERFGATLR